MAQALSLGEVHHYGLPPILSSHPMSSADDGDHYIPITLDLFFDNMQRYIAGDALMNVVRPQLGY